MNKRKRVKKSDKKKLIDNLRERERETKKNLEKEKRAELNDGGKIESKNNLYTKESEVKRVMFLNKPMILLLYKEALFNTDQLDTSLPSSIVFLL